MTTNKLRRIQSNYSPSVLLSFHVQPSPRVQVSTCPGSCSLLWGGTVTFLGSRSSALLGPWHSAFPLGEEMKRGVALGEKS